MSEAYVSPLNVVIAEETKSEVSEEIFKTPPESPENSSTDVVRWLIINYFNLIHWVKIGYPVQQRPFFVVPVLLQGEMWAKKTLFILDNSI